MEPLLLRGLLGGFGLRAGSGGLAARLGLFLWRLGDNQRFRSAGDKTTLAASGGVFVKGALLTARSISLWASRRALVVASASPVEAACRAARMSACTARLTCRLCERRFSAWRARLMADLMIGMGMELSVSVVEYRMIVRESERLVNGLRRSMGRGVDTISVNLDKLGHLVYVDISTAKAQRDELI